MIQTFIALTFAHILADYLLQPAWMVARKKEPGILLLHTVMVLITAMLAIGRVDAWELLVLAAAHLTIDAVKTYLAPNTLTAHLTDQGAHLATIFAIAAIAPDLWSTGIYLKHPEILTVMLHAGGLILATRAGGFAVGLLMNAHTSALPESDQSGLPKGGWTIGLLERGLIYVLIAFGQPGAIGWLIAAKSILRFGTVQEDRAASEYVIIGTLASFGWAITVAYAVTKLAEIAALP